MRQLAEKASMITPNLTEALLLLYGKKKCIAGGSICPAGTEDIMVESGKPDRRSQRTFIQKQ